MRNFPFFLQATTFFSSAMVGISPLAVIGAAWGSAEFFLDFLAFREAHKGMSFNSKTEAEKYFAEHGKAEELPSKGTKMPASIEQSPVGH